MFPFQVFSFQLPSDAAVPCCIAVFLVVLLAYTSLRRPQLRVYSHVTCHCRRNLPSSVAWWKLGVCLWKILNSLRLQLFANVENGVLSESETQYAEYKNGISSLLKQLREVENFGRLLYCSVFGTPVMLKSNRSVIVFEAAILVEVTERVGVSR